MTLGEMSATQRGAMLALNRLGGKAKRLEIAKQSGVDGTRIAASLTRLESFGYVEPGEDQRWRLTESGYSALEGVVTIQVSEISLPPPNPVEPEPKPKPEPATPKPEPKPEKNPVGANGRSPIAQSPSPRDAMAAELRALAVTAPPFPADDAAWLCRALHRQFADMPSVAAMLGQIADYFSNLSGGCDARRG